MYSALISMARPITSVVIVEAYDGLADAIDAANSTPFALQTNRLRNQARTARDQDLDSVIRFT
jgi:hypothetical protein